MCQIKKIKADLRPNGQKSKNPLRPAARCAILIIEKRESQRSGLPPNNYDNCFAQPVTIGSSGRLLFSLEDLITKTNKSDNEYHQLD